MFKLNYVERQDYYYVGYSIMHAVTDLYGYACNKLWKGNLGMYGKCLILHYNAMENDKEYFMIRKWRSYYV